MKIGLLGASGFVGSAVAQAISDAGHEVVPVSAPRLTSSARTLRDTQTAVTGMIAPPALDALDECDVVINAAGAATPGGTDSDELYGANALLPALLVQAMAARPGRRLVHISSAAVHGAARRLVEDDVVEPVTPYGMSKLLGEQAATASGHGDTEVVVYRPTSVHGAGRGLTQSLIGFSRSRLSSVAAPGDRPTPQVLVQNVAAVAVHLATTPVAPETPVLHPWEQVTTRMLLTGLSGGRTPILVPAPVARAAVAAALALGRLHPAVKAQARRLEMLWFGQAQAEGWLSQHGPEQLVSWHQAFPELASSHRR